MPQDAFIPEIVKIIDYWSDLGGRAIDGDAAASWSSYSDEYRAMADAVRGTDAALVFKHLLREVCEGMAHSILALIDGDGPIPPSVVTSKDGQLVAGGALHEKLMEQLAND